METRNLIRLSGLLLAIAGLLYIVLIIVPPPSVDQVGTARWTVSVYAITIHHFFLLFGVFGLFVYQFKDAGRLGLAAFVLVSLANLIVAGVGLIEITMFPPMAADAATRPMLACTIFFQGVAGGQAAPACEAMALGSLTAWVAASVLLLLIGSMLLGISMIRARRLPPAAGILLIVGWIYYLASMFLPLPATIANLALPLVGLGYVYAGYAIWADKQAS